MARYLVTMKDRTTQAVAGADAYLQEGQMTTFFRTAGVRTVVDSWSTRLFSVRTSEILMVRREDDGDIAADPTPMTARSLAPLQALRTTA